MNPELLFRVGSAQRMEILMLIKRSEGLTVGELAQRLGMSYMGVKAHCDELRKAKLCESRRRSLGRSGRPEMLLRLTERGNELFPAPDLKSFVRMLEAAQAIYGPAAPEKMLLGYYRELERAHAEKMPSGDLQSRLEILRKLREKEGVMPELHWEDAASPANWRWIEYQNFSAWLEEHYPICGKFEEQMFSRLLGVTVLREMHDSAKTQRRVVFAPISPVEPN